MQVFKLEITTVMICCLKMHTDMRAKRLAPVIIQARCGCPKCVYHAEDQLSGHTYCPALSAGEGACILFMYIYALHTACALPVSALVSPALCVVCCESKQHILRVRLASRQDP